MVFQPSRIAVITRLTCQREDIDIECMTTNERCELLLRDGHNTHVEHVECNDAAAHICQVT